jgi:hypothetical protein
MGGSLSIRFATNVGSEHCSEVSETRLMDGSVSAGGPVTVRGTEVALSWSGPPLLTPVFPRRGSDLSSFPPFEHRTELIAHPAAITERFHPEGSSEPDPARLSTSRTPSLE